ncbi:MAG: Hsp20/alpha crystallin family protein [Synergistaceae bacterium]|jgi:HSP20 family molecular chaperone IbpA|nr:Hsp20/alpha crystallin family protein [Synergistaceae bacterium]
MSERKELEEDKIRKLEEEIKRLKEEKEEKEEESPAEEILKGIGGMMPGLGGVFKGLKKSPAFKERLNMIDQELERKFRETPLKRTEEEKFNIKGKFEARDLAPNKPVMRNEAPPPRPKEQPPDIFDEEDHIKVIAEIPWVDENDINLDLQGDKLTISVGIPKHKYYQELKLPCEPKGKLEKSYRNGILELKITKKSA